MQEQAKAMGVHFVLADAQNDVAKQASDIQDLTGRGVNALIVTAVDNNAVVAPLKAVMAKKIPIFAAYNLLGNATGIPGTASCALAGTAGWVGNNEKGWAQLDGEEAVKLLPNGGNVVIVNGLAGVAATKIRYDTFLATIKQNPKIKVIASQPGNYDRNTARTAMENLLQANKKIDLVYAPDDNMAVGAIQALKAAGRLSQTKVVAIGGSQGRPQGGPGRDAHRRRLGRP